MTTTKEKLPASFIKARRELLLDHPFFGSLIMHLMPVVDNNQPTLWVDGQRLGFNSTFFDGLDVRQGAGVLAHEVLHCACEHPLRRVDREKEVWNDACDHVVNPIVLESGLPLPEGTLSADPRFTGMGAEEIYKILQEGHDQKNPGSEHGLSPPQGQQGVGRGEVGAQGQSQGQKPNSGPAISPQGQDPSPCPTGEVRDLPGEGGGAASPAERTHEAQEWKTNIQQAINSAKGQGFYPSQLEKYISDLLTPEVDWREELAKWFKSTARNEASWMRANRRFIGAGLYLPGVKSTASGVGILFLDTSGSIWGSPKLLEQFNAELNSMLDEVRPERLYVVHVDAAVQKVEEYAPDDYPVTLTAQGGGGTDFCPAFEWVTAQDLQPDWTVYLTDMQGTFPAQEPEYPVLWAATNERRGPFGETIRLKEIF